MCTTWRTGPSPAIWRSCGGPPGPCWDRPGPTDADPGLPGPGCSALERRDDHRHLPAGGRAVPKGPPAPPCRASGACVGCDGVGPICEGVRVTTATTPSSPAAAPARKSRRRRLLLGTLLAASVMLTGTACATSATSAAVVGTTTITEQSIFDQTAQASGRANQPLTVDQLAFGNRLFTTQDIRSALLTEVAQQRGVVVTDAQVNAAMAG